MTWYFCSVTRSKINRTTTCETGSSGKRTNTFVMSYRIACTVILLFLVVYWMGFHAVDLEPAATHRTCNISFEQRSLLTDERGHAMLDAFFASLLSDPRGHEYSIIIDPHSNGIDPDMAANLEIQRTQWIIDHCRVKYNLPASRFYIQDIDDNSSSHLPGFAGIILRLKRTGG